MEIGRLPGLQGISDNLLTDGSQKLKEVHHPSSYPKVDK